MCALYKSTFTFTFLLLYFLQISVPTAAKHWITVTSRNIASICQILPHNLVCGMQTLVFRFPRNVIVGYFVLSLGVTHSTCEWCSCKWLLILFQPTWCIERNNDSVKYMHSYIMTCFFINFYCQTFNLMNIENYCPCEIITGQDEFKCNIMFEWHWCNYPLVILVLRPAIQQPPYLHCTQWAIVYTCECAH